MLIFFEELRDTMNSTTITEHPPVLCDKKYIFFFYCQKNLGKDETKQGSIQEKYIKDR